MYNENYIFIFVVVWVLGWVILQNRENIEQLNLDSNKNVNSFLF